MGELSTAPRVPAEVLHTGDRVVIEKDGGLIPSRIVMAVHGTTMVSNIVILYCQPDSNPDPDAQMVLPYSSEALIERVYANAMAAA